MGAAEGVCARREKSVQGFGRVFSVTCTVVHMNSPVSLASLVLALFDLVRLGLPADADRLAGRLGIAIDRVERGLSELGRRGLVDVARVRLTLTGLALASQLDMERSARLLGLAPANDAPTTTQRVA